jgi:hypothetical protein
MGYSEVRAYQIVTAEVARLNNERSEVAAEVRRIDLERLDALLDGVWAPAQAGDEKAIASVLAIMARRAKLLGLDAPVKQSVTVSAMSELSDDELTSIATGETSPRLPAPVISDNGMSPAPNETTP